MKKLTLVLVALLLALACVFAACGKKNDTPTDTDPKPVDTDPTPVVNPTVAKEDLVKIAEALKDAYVANYVDLYSAEVETAIDGAKSEALLKINSASSKEEAQKIADDFIAFLKAQKTTVDELKALIEKIGDVALADEDAVNEANAYVGALEKAYAGNNAAKKAVLDAYKADKEIKKTVEAMFNFLQGLKKAKDEADKKGGINAKIAAKAEDFAETDKVFKLTDVNGYEALVAEAKKLADDYKITVGSDAYNEIIDVKTLAQMKATLDAAVAADPVLVAIKGVVDAAAALEKTAKAARYVETITVDTEALKDKKDDIKGEAVPVKYEGALKWAPAEVSDEDAEEENIKEVEIDINTKYFDGKDALREYYKLSLKADVEAAKKVSDTLFTSYPTSKLTAYGYNDKDDKEVLNAAAKSIAKTAAAYNTSLEKAIALFKDNFITDNYVDVALKQGDDAITYGTLGGFTSNKNKDDYQTKLAAEIDKAVATFKRLDGKDLLSASNFEYKPEDAPYTIGTHKVFIEGNEPVIKYKAWEYSYKLGDAAFAADTAVFNALDVLTKKDGKAEKSAQALKWLVVFIGEGNYADKYELVKDYGFAKDLIMVDQDVTEEAKADVVKINGEDVKVEKTAAVTAKVLSPYTIAKALVAEQEKIKAAQDAAVEEVKVAALALREAGDANAVEALRDLYDGITSGAYINEKVYGEEADAKYDAYLKVTDGLKVEVKAAYKTEDPKFETIANLLDKAETAVAKATAVLAANEAAIESSLKDDEEKAKFFTLDEVNAAAKAVKDANDDLTKNATFAKVFDLIVAKAQAKYDTAKAGYDISSKAPFTSKEDYEKAEYALTAVNNIKALLTREAVFADLNNAAAKEVKITITTTASENETTIGAKLSAFAPTAAEIEAAGIDAEEYTYAKLLTYLAKIAAKETTNARADLEAALTNKETALAEALKAYQGFAAVKADVAAANVANLNELKKAIDDFAGIAYADFINLKLAVTFGETTFEFDVLTELYKELAMAKTYAVIAKVQNYAASLDAKYEWTDKRVENSVAAGEGTTWVAAAQGAVKAQAFTFDAVESIKAADTRLKNYVLIDAVYDFEAAVDCINGVLTAEANKKPAIDLEALKGYLAAN